MREVFIYAFALDIEPLLTGSRKILLLAKDEGKLSGFVEEETLRTHPLIEGNLYILWGNIKENKTFSAQSWELLEEFSLPYQKKLVSTFKETVKNYFPDGTGGYCFNLLLHTLRKTKDRISLLVNYAWLYTVLCKREGLGFSDKEIKPFILYKKVNKTTLEKIIKTINKLRKNVLES